MWANQRIRTRQSDACEVKAMRLNQMSSIVNRRRATLILLPKSVTPILISYPLKLYAVEYTPRFMGPAYVRLFTSFSSFLQPVQAAVKLDFWTAASSGPYLELSRHLENLLHHFGLNLQNLLFTPFATAAILAGAAITTKSENDTNLLRCISLSGRLTCTETSARARLRLAGVSRTTTTVRCQCGGRASFHHRRTSSSRLCGRIILVLRL